jgi:hypothetical protein
LRTSLGIDQITIRRLAATMAIVLMMASLPTIGVIVIADRSGPSLSLDVCHPLQSLDSSSSVVLIARPAPPEIDARIASRETFQELISIAKDTLSDTPDPPPPKQIS